MPECCEFDKFSVDLLILECCEFHEGSEAETAKCKCDYCERQINMSLMQGVKLS